MDGGPAGDRRGLLAYGRLEGLSSAVSLVVPRCVPSCCSSVLAGSTPASPFDALMACVATGRDAISVHRTASIKHNRGRKYRCLGHDDFNLAKWSLLLFCNDRMTISQKKLARTSDAALRLDGRLALTPTQKPSKLPHLTPEADSTLYRSLLLCLQSCRRSLISSTPVPRPAMRARPAKSSRSSPSSSIPHALRRGRRSCTRG